MILGYMTGELQPQCNVAVGKENMGMLQPKSTAHCLCQCPAGCTSPLHVTGAQEPTCLAVFPASCRNINVLEKSLLPLASSLWSHKGLHRGWTGCYIRREEFLLSIPLGWSSLVSHCLLKVLCMATSDTDICMLWEFLLARIHHVEYSPYLLCL